MANFLLLYSGGKMPDNEAEQGQVMQAWEAWFHQLGDSVVDGGNPFTPTSKTISSEGAVSTASGSASGYSVIKAGSLDDAVAKAKACPVLQGGASITVYETFPAM